MVATKCAGKTYNLKNKIYKLKKKYLSLGVTPCPKRAQIDINTWIFCYQIDIELGYLVTINIFFFFLY